MCLTTKTKRQVASEDIKCFKVIKRFIREGSSIVTIDGKTFMEVELRSAIQQFEYSFHKLYTSSFRVTRCSGNTMINGGHIIINEGLHSFTNLVSAKNCHGKDSNKIIVECTIPSGSRFYINTAGTEYASDQIILNKVYNGSTRKVRK